MLRKQNQQNQSQKQSQQLRPRERSRKFGYSSLSDGELVALCLRTGNREKSVFTLGEEIAPDITENVSKGKRTDQFLSTLQEKLNIGKVQMHVLGAVYELLLRQQLQRWKVPQYSTPLAIIHLFPWLRRKRQEYLYALYFSGRLQLLEQKFLAKGAIDSVPVDLLDVFHYAIRYRARNIVLIHNHPTGEIQPSNQDFSVTKYLKSEGDKLGITLLDHIIVSKQGYFSFKESTSVL